MVDKVEWLQMGPTKDLLEHLEQAISQLSVELSNGATVKENVDQTSMLTAKYTGCIYALNLAIDLIKADPNVVSEENSTPEYRGSGEDVTNYSQEYADPESEE